VDDAVEIGCGAAFDGLSQCRMLIVVQQRRLAGSFAVDQPVETACIAAHQPVTHDLQGHTAQSGGIRARTAVIDRGKRQEPTSVAGVPCLSGKRRSLSPSKSAWNETAEPFANLLFAPSIEIRRLLGIPSANISEDWYYPGSLQIVPPLPLKLRYEDAAKRDIASASNTASTRGLIIGLRSPVTGPMA
jgi:hypothetical protein